MICADSFRCGVRKFGVRKEQVRQYLREYLTPKKEQKEPDILKRNRNQHNKGF